jgi:regulator of sirC expression with transglutaminase-like and TPR domain
MARLFYTERPARDNGVAVDYLRQLLVSESPNVRLDRAALDLARIQFPDLEHQPVLDQMNEIAANLGDRLRNFNDGRDFVEKAQSYLFGELGFRANETDFFDPRNSCLNQVLERRTGIPITLSLLYMEVARRLQMPVFGIGLPNRFIVQFDDGRFAAFIDPFGGGRQVSPSECFAMAGATVADPMLLARASKKQILMRMLQNLHRAYVQVHDYDRAILALNFLLDGAPGTAAWHKMRGALALELKRYASARADFETYLELQPQAQDRDTVLKQLQSIHRRVVRNN